MIIVSPASPSVRIWEAPRHAQVAADGLIINKLLRVSPFVVRFNSSVPTITFFIIIDNVFSWRRSARIASFLSDNYKRTKYMKKLIIYLLMTVWMGISIVLLCNEDESAALLPFALIKAGALVSFLASTKVLCIITDRKLI